MEASAVDLQGAKMSSPRFNMAQARSIGETVRAVLPAASAKAPSAQPSTGAASRSAFVDADAERAISVALRQKDSPVRTVRSTRDDDLAARHAAAVAETAARGRRASVDLIEKSEAAARAARRGSTDVGSSTVSSAASAVSGSAATTVDATSPAARSRAHGGLPKLTHGVTPALTHVPDSSPAAHVLILNSGSSKRQQYATFADRTGLRVSFAASIGDAVAAVTAAASEATADGTGVDVLLADLAEGPDIVVDLLRQMRAVRATTPVLVLAPPANRAAAAVANELVIGTSSSSSPIDAASVAADEEGVAEALMECSRLGCEGVLRKPVADRVLASRIGSVAACSRKALAILREVCRPKRPQATAAAAAASGVLAAGFRHEADASHAEPAESDGSSEPAVPPASAGGAAAAPSASKGPLSLDPEHLPPGHLAAVRANKVLQAQALLVTAASSDSRSDGRPSGAGLTDAALEAAAAARFATYESYVLGNASAADLQAALPSLNLTASLKPSKPAGAGAASDRYDAAVAAAATDRAFPRGLRPGSGSSDVRRPVAAALGLGLSHSASSPAMPLVAGMAVHTQAGLVLGLPAGMSVGWRPAGPAHVFAEVGGYTFTPPHAQPQPPAPLKLLQRRALSPSLPLGAGAASAVATGRPSASAALLLPAPAPASSGSTVHAGATAVSGGVTGSASAPALPQARPRSSGAGRLRSSSGPSIAALTRSGSGLHSGPGSAGSSWASTDLLAGDPREPPESSLQNITRSHQLMHRALGRHRVGEEAEAVSLLSQALRMNPKLRPARLLRGCALFKLRRVGEALADWKACLAASDHEAEIGAAGAGTAGADPIAAYNVALAQAALGDAAGAIDSLGALLEARPKDRDALQLRSLLYRRRGQYERAQRDAASAMYANMEAPGAKGEAAAAAAAAAAREAVRGKDNAWLLAPAQGGAGGGRNGGGGGASLLLPSGRRGSVSALPGKGAFAAAFARAVQRMEAEAKLRTAQGSDAATLADESIKSSLSFTAAATLAMASSTQGTLAAGMKGSGAAGAAAASPGLLSSSASAPAAPHGAAHSSSIEAGVNPRTGFVGGASASHSLLALTHSPAQTASQLRDVLAGATDIVELLFGSPTALQTALRTPPAARTGEQLELIADTLSAAIPALRGMARDGLIAAAGACFSRVFVEGEAMAREGEDAEALMLVLSGAAIARVKQDPSAAAATSTASAAGGASPGAGAGSPVPGHPSLGYVAEPLAAGAIVNDLPLFFGSEHSETVIARGAAGVEALLLPRSAFFNLHLDEPWLGELAAKVDMLRRTGAFPALPEDTLLQLAAHARRRTFRGGETLLRQGEAGADLLVLSRGVVHALRTSDALAHVDARLTSLRVQLGSLREGFAYHHSLMEDHYDGDGAPVPTAASLTGAARLVSPLSSTPLDALPLPLPLPLPVLALGRSGHGGGGLTVAVGAGVGPKALPAGKGSLSSAAAAAVLTPKARLHASSSAGALPAGKSARMGSGRLALAAASGSAIVAKGVSSHTGKRALLPTVSSSSGTNAAAATARSSKALSSVASGGPPSHRPGKAHEDAAGVGAGGSGSHPSATGSGSTTARSGFPATGAVSLERAPATRMESADAALLAVDSEGQLQQAATGRASRASTSSSDGMMRSDFDAAAAIGSSETEAAAQTGAGSESATLSDLEASTRELASFAVCRAMSVADIPSTYAERLAAGLQRQIAQLERRRATLIANASAAPTATRVRVQVLFPPAVISGLAICDPAHGREAADFVAETFVEVLAVPRHRIDLAAFSKDAVAAVAARCPHAPSDEEVAALAARESHWERVRASVKDNLDRSRWPLKEHGLAAEPLPGGRQRLVPVPTLRQRQETASNRPVSL